MNTSLHEHNHNDECNNTNDDSKALMQSDHHISLRENHQQEYTNEINSDEEISNLYSENDYEEFQIHRHIALTIMLVVTMGFGFFLCLWRLINEDVSGIYIELEFLDCVFNFGQGFILWAIFGLDNKLIVIPFKKRIQRLFQSFHKLHIPKEENLSPEVCRIRNMFLTYHVDNCRNEISRDIRQNFHLYQNAFTGRELINWILKADLEDDRLKAHAYGQALLISRVIEHVRRSYNLMDDDEYLYQFTDYHLESNSSEYDNISTSDISVLH